MTTKSLSVIVSELSREGSRCAYLLLSDTEQKAVEMYELVKKEIISRGTLYRIINFSPGLANLPDPFQYQQDPSLLLLENTASVSADESETLNAYIKQLTDSAAGPLLWYLSVSALGQLKSGYGSRAAGAFMTITGVISD